MTPPRAQAAAFAPAPAKAAPRAAPLNAVGLYYSTTTGNTETVAGYLTAATGIEAVDIDSVDDETLTSMDALICGAPTWHTGADEQRSGTAWDEFLYDRLPSLDLSGKKVAIFGLGDQGSYGDNFCDAAGELYDCFSAQGATMVGLTATDDYDYSDSKALRDGKFCGLLCDEDNEYDKSEGRANDWVEQLKGEGVAFGARLGPPGRGEKRARAVSNDHARPSLERLGVARMTCKSGAKGGGATARLYYGGLVLSIKLRIR